MQRWSFGTRPVKNAYFELETSNQCLFVFSLLLYQLAGHAIFFKFLVTAINHYHINGLHLFWDSFEWFCLQISKWRKIFFFSGLRRKIFFFSDRGLIVIIEYYCLIRNKKEHNISSSRVINSHMGPMYIETPDIYIYIYIYM